MKVIIPGLVYEVEHVKDKTKTTWLSFVSANGDGVINEDLIEVLLRRLNYLQTKLPCKENACAITKLEEALMWLEKRTKNRSEKSALELAAEYADAERKIQNT